MKLQVTQSNLAKALGLTSKIAGSRGLTLPVLQNVLIKTDKNRVKISANNLDIAITCYIGAKVEQEGAITVPARIFHEFVMNLSSGVIDLETDGNRLNIASSSHKSIINGISAEDYPELPSVENPKTFMIPAEEFKRALTKTVFAAGSDDTRPVLTAVILHTIGKNKKITLAATDSYRLSHYETTISSEDDLKLLIPATTMSEVLRSIDENIDQIEIQYDDDKIHFLIGEIEIISRLLDGKYPDYMNLIPTEFSTTISVVLSEIASLAKISGIFAKEAAGGITIDVSAPESKISVRSIASQLGENVSELESKVVGESLSITLNSRYLVDGLNTIDSLGLEICFNGSSRPALLRDTKMKNYIHLIMPVVV
jgi:DNA polymerase III subunit beta